MDLIIRGRKRDNKSMNKKDRNKNKVSSPKQKINTSKVLKRIKSSEALNDKIGYKHIRCN
jgi:hypothetical protein